MPSTATSDLEGQRFGSLVVVGLAPPILQTDGKRKGAVLAQCDCGEVKIFTATNLKSGNSKSCGCLKFTGMRMFNTTRATPQPWAIDGDVATLTICGIRVMVDVVDLPTVNKFRWGLRNGYAMARGGRLSMHRLLLGLGVGDRREVDHRNHDTTDNRTSSNIRIATSSQNKQNNRGQPDASSRFKGVIFDRERNKYRAQIKAEGRYRMIGRFGSEEDAAAAYNREALKYFGEFAYLNDIRGAV